MLPRSRIKLSSAAMARRMAKLMQQVHSGVNMAGKVELSPEWGHVRDEYAFGVLAEQLMEFLVDLGDMTKTFELRIQDEFLNPDPKERPLMNTLLDDRLFKNEFVEIVNFLKSVTVKSEEEKKKFFSGLAKKLHQLPPTLVASRLVRPLLARFVLLDSTATECVVPHLLTPYIGEERRGEFVEGQLNPILPEPLFRTQIIPEVYKIFHVRDLHIRMVLLKHFSAFVKYFDHGTLRTVLLPQLLLGLRDVNDALAEASLRAIADLIPLLGGDIVIGPSRLRVFAEGKPKFNGLNGSISIKTRKSTPDNSVSSIVGLNKKNLRESEGSASTSDITGEKQTLKQIARQAEREKRREEAKRRSEERRKRREERNKNPIKAVLVDKAEKKNVIVEDEKVEINEQDGDAGTHDAPGDQSHDQILPAEDTEEKGDWSDWEPVAEKDTASVSSGDIDQEIENEIKKMESTLPPEAKDRLSRISASDSEVGGSADMSPEHMVLNAENLKDKKGVLRLSSGKHRASPPPARTDYTSEYESHSRVESVDKIRRQTVNSPKQTQSFDGQKDDKTGWDSHWDEDAHSSTTHQKRGLKTQSHKASASISKKIAISELGSEFDIKSLDIKTSKPSETNVLDFFAGMEPTIQKKGDIFSQFGLPLDTGSVEVDSPTVKSDKKGQDPTAKTLSFAVMDMDGQVSLPLFPDWKDFCFASISCWRD